MKTAYFEMILVEFFEVRSLTISNYFSLRYFKGSSLNKFLGKFKQK